MRKIGDRQTENKEGKDRAKVFFLLTFCFVNTDAMKVQLAEQNCFFAFILFYFCWLGAR